MIQKALHGWESRSVSKVYLSRSPRRMQVLQLLAVGHSNRAIAEELGLAERTVINYASATPKILGVSNRTAAVQRARKLSILDD